MANTVLFAPAPTTTTADQSPPRSVFITAHGAADYHGTERETIAGTELELVSFKLRHSGAIIRFPRDRLAGNDRVEPITKKLAADVLQMLVRPPSQKALNQTWQMGRGADHYETELQQADARGFATIFAELNDGTASPPSKERLRGLVAENLIAVVAIVFASSPEAAKRRIDRALTQADRPLLP